MQDNGQLYLDKLSQVINHQISANINEHLIYKVVELDLVKAHLEYKVSVRFQTYYFATLNNEKLFFDSNDFFRIFKKQYSLQGIDNNYLDLLEKSKVEIMKNIRADNLAQLFFATFRMAKIKHGEGFAEKNLGSFFSKLVHTFRPDTYCALDNPIKNYFGLKNESFFIAFIIVSKEYKIWSANNKSLLENIKIRFKNADKEKVFDHNRLTDLKLLDLVFWGKANR